VAQQDLSGTTGSALYRSPNAIVSTFIYDTSRDSDPGWVDRCNWQSWINEPLVGTWLYGPSSGFGSELDARDWLGVGQSPTTGSLITGDSQTFSNSVGGWLVSQYVTLTNPSGRLRMTFTGTSGQVPIAYIALTTVANQRYRIDFTYATSVNGKNTFIGAGTTPTGSTLGSLVMSTGTIGSKTVSFVATSTTTYINFSGSTQWATNDYAEIDNITCTPVSYATNPSGAYYQDNTTGKFQRLWKNLLPNSAWLGGTSGTESAGAVAPTGWSFSSNSGSVTYGSSTYNPSGNSIRFQASAQRPYVTASYGVTSGATYAQSVKVEAITSGAPTLNDLLGLAAVTTSAMTYRANGAAVSYTYVVQAGDVLEVEYTFNASGSAQFRFGPGCGGNTTMDVTLSAPQVEFVLAGGSATAFENKSTSDTGITEVFRGNTASFPRLAALIAEANYLTIFDLTKPGRPMWMRFNGNVNPTTNWWASGSSITAIAMVNGRMYVGASVSGMRIVNFASDDMDIAYTANAGKPQGGISTRNGTANWLARATGIALVGGVVNAIAATVLPDAPFDPATGLQVPTIAVATSTSTNGISVIRHDGSVVNTMYGGVMNVSFDARGNAVTMGENNCNYRKAWASTGYQSYSTFVGGPLTFGSGNLVPAGSAAVSSRHYGRLSVVNENSGAFAMVRDNDSAPGSTLAAMVTTYSNTGWLTGDIRRCWLSDTSTGPASSTTVVTNGTFDTDLTGWSPVIANLTWVAPGQMQIVHNNSSNAGRAVQGPLLVPGRTYRVRCDVVSLVGDATGARVGIGDANGNAQSGWAGGSLIAGSSSVVGTGTIDATFVITPGSVYNLGYFGVFAQGGTYTNGGGIIVDNVIVTELVSDRSYRNKPLTIYGTLTRTAVASAAQLMFYSGWSGTNYAQEAYSADHDFGTGGWRIGAWINNPVATGFAPANFVANSSLAGAVSGVIGSGGAFPTTMSAGSTGNTLTYTVTTGTTTGGQPKISVRVQGTPVNGNGFRLFLGNSGGMTPAANGQAFYFQLQGAITGGSNANTSNPVLYVDEYDTNNGYLGTLNFGQITGSTVATVGAVNTVNQSATAKLSSPYIYLGTTANAPIDITFDVAVPQMNRGTTPCAYVSTSGSQYLGFAPIYERSASTGPYIKAGIDCYGCLAVEAYDGTTTRRATSSAACNSGANFKASFEYTTDGTLRVGVDGITQGTATGNPLLTLSNSSAVVTVGNSRTLDSAFPGSIALLRPTATVPTSDQKAFMYAQEQALFQPAAQCCLPDSGAIVQIAYDSMQDRVKVVSAANESTFSGLTMTSYAPASAGSISKASHQSGVKLIARSGTMPGVDVTVPAYGLLSELFNRAERAARLSRTEEVFDWIGGFTAAVSSNTTGLSAFSPSLTAGSAYPLQTTLVGAQLTASTLPAGASLQNLWNYSTGTLSAPIGTGGSAVAFAFTDFILPYGYEAKSVLVNGVFKQEGSTKDWTRIYDGFRETIRFAVAPGSTAWVQIKARKVA
jgi:hypothetical protein